MRDENLALGAFEPAPGAGVRPSEEAASLASPDGDVAAAGALELYCLLAGGYSLAAGDTGRHFAQLTIKPTADYLKVKQVPELSQGEAARTARHDPEHPGVGEGLPEDPALEVHVPLLDECLKGRLEPSGFDGCEDAVHPGVRDGVQEPPHPEHRGEFPT